MSVKKLGRAKAKTVREQAWGDQKELTFEWGVGGDDRYASIGVLLRGFANDAPSMAEYKQRYYAHRAAINAWQEEPYNSPNKEPLWHKTEECRKSLNEIREEKLLGEADAIMAADTFLLRCGKYCIYRTSFYKLDRTDYSDEEVLVQVLDLEDKERQKFERLKHKLSASSQEIESKRERIPEDVRIAVWRRDSGKCVRCESRDRLEYDHIIPLSKGGSNTVRNIELLCETCNREKGAAV